MLPLDRVLNSLLGNGPVTDRVRISICVRLLLYFGFTLLAGCTSAPPNHFTFTADLPPGFAYSAIAVYVPDEGESCTVPGGRKTKVAYNRIWWKEYQPDSVIALYRTVSGCPLVLRRIELQIAAAYSDDWFDFGEDSGLVAIRYELDELDELDEQYKEAFNAAGESTFHGQCQWLFRTMGPKRRIVKILDCKAIDAKGQLGAGHPFAGYTLDQLPGKTVRLNITLANEERPYMGDTWVKFESGWKRCMGENYEDQYAFCYGNHKDFSTFLMFDGRVCSVYPDCTE